MSGASQRARPLLLEGAMVVFAVLLALAVDDLREGHVQRTAAHQALQLVDQEIRANAGRLGATVAGLRNSLAAIAGQPASVGATIEVEFPVALLSESTWSISRATLAAVETGAGPVPTLATIYETQALFLVAQRDCLVRLNDLAAAEPAHARALLRSLRRELEFALAIGDALALEYDGWVAPRSDPTLDQAMSP